MKKNKKKYLIVIAIAAAILIGRSFLLKEPNTELRHTVSMGTLIDSIQVSGTYSATAQTEVVSPTDGVITKIYVANNDQVSTGDLLFHVESTATDQEKAAAYANYLSAISALNKSKQSKQSLDASMWLKQKALLDAQNDLDSMKSNLVEGDNNPTTGEEYTELEVDSIRSATTTALKDFESVERQYKEADTTIASAQAAVTTKKLLYDATKSVTIKAPAEGKIVNLLKVIGDGTRTSTANYTASPVLIIANLDNPSITAKISEAYIPRLKEGQEAEVIFDAVRDQTFTGLVESIDTVGTNINGVTTYEARIIIQDITDNIRPGMTSTITVETFRKDNVLSVPNSSLIFRDGKTYVKNATKKDEELIEIDLGFRGLAEVEVLSGLSEGLEIEI